ncbi:MAG: fatty acid desaturase family protein [Pseudomonadota bacterium]
MTTTAGFPFRFRYADAGLPNLAAFAYALGGWASGLFLITRDGFIANAGGVLLLGHAMIIAAYLVHECAHNTLFARNEDNARAGKILLWLCGGCYAVYEDIRHKHFRHHVDRADVVAFDYRPVLARYPRAVRVLHALEWLYIPAFDLLMHVLIIVLPFCHAPRRQRRGHVLAVLTVRGMLFALLVWYAPRVLLLYPLAYFLMLHVLRFMDAFQHTYDVDDRLDQPRPATIPHDAAYEHRNTFTNLHSAKYPWLNLLTLNFGYHNVHHDKPVQPWYRLPRLQRELYGDGDDATGQSIPFRNQLHAYHRYRTQRLLNADPADMGLERIPHAERGRTFIGVDGVSFLITH